MKCGIQGGLVGTAWVALLCAGLAGAQSGGPKHVDPAAGVDGGSKVPVGVPSKPADTAKALRYRDRHYGVRFEVPPGWQFTRKDREVSTFHLDARSAGEDAEMRGVATIGYNPYPLSTFSGALFYYSVEKHMNDADCAAEAGQFSRTEDLQNIGGADWTHGRDEHGTMCVEARDEVYTAFRKGACYRFDLQVNTFCSQASGAQEMTVRQYREIQRQMGTILESVKLNWKPEKPSPEKPSPEQKPAAPEGRRPLVDPVEKPAVTHQSFRQGCPFEGQTARSMIRGVSGVAERSRVATVTGSLKRRGPQEPGLRKSTPRSWWKPGLWEWP